MSEVDDDALSKQRVTMDELRAALRADMQPEKREPTVADLPALWLSQESVYPMQERAARTVLRLCARELADALASEPHLTLSADAVQTLAGSRDLERRCKQLEREVDVYRRALAQIINVHALEKPSSYDR